MSNPNSRPGYRGNPSDPRLSQQQQQQQQYPNRPGSQHMQTPRQQPQGGQRIQSYGMDQLNRPRPPPHNRPSQQQQQPSQQRSSRQQQGVPQLSSQQRGSREHLYQSSRQPQQPGGPRPMRPPGNYAANPSMAPPNNGQGPYRRVSMNRSRSLSRPERQRPRTGMIRSPSQQQRINQQQQQGRYGPPGGPGQQGPAGPPGSMRPRPNNYPMPNRLQHQLQQQKIYQQEALLDQQPAQKKPPPEEEIKVLTNWWAWIAFLLTCCFPNWFLRVCLKKNNAMVQQAWREKVKKK